MKKIPFGKPIIDDREKEAVINVMNGSVLVHGPISIQFENKFASFTNSPHAVSCVVVYCRNALNLLCIRLWPRR
jgi:dTDP-4-amino-4,6-dideoxygalactose transaminase